MWRIIGVCGLVVLMLVASGASAQEGGLPGEEAAFIGSYLGETADTVFVASVDEAGTWTVTPLPEQPILRQEYSSLVVPRWSPDGTRIYTSLLAELIDGYSHATQIGVYDRVSESMSVLMDVPTFQAGIEARSFSVESVSPDGRYAYLEDTNTFAHGLVELEEGRVIRSDLCFSEVLGWRAESVISHYTELYECPPSVQEISLETGESLSSVDFPDPWTTTYFGAHSLADGRLVTPAILPSVAHDDAYPAHVSVLDFATGEHLILDDMTSLVALAADESAFAYLEANTRAIKRVHLATLEVETLAEAGATYPTYIGNTLYFWYWDGENLTRGMIEGETRTDTVFTSSTPETAIQSLLFTQTEISYNEEYRVPLAILPDQQTVVLTDENGLQILRPGEEVSLSGALLPEGVAPSEPPLVMVTPSAEWIVVQQRYEGGAVWSAVNVVTGAVQMLPEQPYQRVVSASPDGAWWLVSSFIDEAESDYALYAYQPATNSWVSLLEEVTLAEINFHWSPQMYYVWYEG